MTFCKEFLKTEENSQMLLNTRYISRFLTLYFTNNLEGFLACKR